MLFDLDGTILSHERRQPSEGVYRALEDAREAGFSLAVCSGRCWGLIPRPLVHRGVMDYYVCSNGSTVLDHSGRPILRNPMDADLCLEVMQTVADLKPGWNCFTGPHAFAEPQATSYMMGNMKRALSPGDDGTSGGNGALAALRAVAGTASMLVQLIGSVGFLPAPSVRFVLSLWHHGLEKMGASFPNSEACSEAVRRLRALGKLEVIEMGYGEIEITAAGTTKGTGTDWLLSHLGLSKEDAIAFGDSENDLPLLGHVGRFVAMGNATPAVKAQADDICGPIGEDGVATWLEYFLRDSTK